MGMPALITTTLHRTAIGAISRTTVITGNRTARSGRLIPAGVIPGGAGSIPAGGSARDAGGVGSHAFMIADSATITTMGSVFRAAAIIISPFVVASEMGLGVGVDSPVPVAIINSPLRAGVGPAEEIGHSQVIMALPELDRLADK